MTNKFRFICIAFLIFSLLSGTLKSQAVFQSDKELKKQGDVFLKEENYSEAYNYYSQLVLRNPKDAEYNYYLGICAIYTVANKEQAVTFLELAAGSSEIENEVFYYLGRAYALSYRFEDAIIQFNKYKEKAPAKSVEKYQVDQYITMCKNGTRFIRNISDWIVVEKKEMNLKDFFLAYEIAPEVGKLLIKPNEEMFKSSIDSKKKEESIIYLAKDNNQIYFSSYGETEANGKDIYRINKLPNGAWSKAQALSNVINTNQDEDYPFLHPNGKILYFCSKGHTSMGGYDIFKSTYNEATESWGPPVNLGFPINSPDDDMLYITDMDEKEAFFASKRTSPNGKISVYKLNIEKRPSSWAIIRGSVKTNRDGQSRSVRITVKDLQDNSLIGVFNSNDKTGRYFLVLPNGSNCLFTVECAEFKTQSQIIAIPLRYEDKPMKQELSYELNTGKLILKTKADVSEEELYADDLPDIVKNKAKLDVTSGTPKTYAAGGEETKGEEYEEVELSDAKLNNDDIVRIAYEDAKELNNEAIELREQADIAMKLANQRNDIALKRVRDADAMLTEANAFTGDPSQKNILLEKANTAKKEAEQLKQEAAAAYNIAKKMDASALRKRKEADLALLYAQTLEASIKAKNSPELMSRLSDLEKQMDELTKNNADTISVFDSYKISMENKNKELEKVQKTITEIKQEIVDNEALITKSQDEADKTRNKSLKEGLLNEIEGLKQDNLDKQDEIKKYENKRKKLQDDYNLLSKEAQMASDIATMAKNDVKPATSITPALPKATVVAATNTKPNAPEKTAPVIIAKPAEASSPASSVLSKSVTPVTAKSVTIEPVAVTTTSVAANTEKANETQPEFKFDDILKELNSFNEEELAEAAKITDEFERETKKANVYNSWSNDLEIFIKEQKGNQEKETDANKKAAIGKFIVKATELAKEKKLLASQATANANAIKQARSIAMQPASLPSTKTVTPVTLTTPTVNPIAPATAVVNNAAPVTSASITPAQVTPPVAKAPATSIKSPQNQTISKQDIHVVLADLNKKYSNEITSAEKIESEINKETKKAEVYNTWSDALNTFVSEQQPQLANETNLNEKAFKQKIINEAIALAREKKSLATQSSLKAQLLAQTTSTAIPPENQKADLAIETQTIQPIAQDIASAEKIENEGEREKAKEAIYKKIAKEAEAEIIKLRIEYNKEKDPVKSIAIANKLKELEKIVFENKNLAKKSLIAAEYYYQHQNKQEDAMEEIDLTPPPVEKPQPPALVKPVAKTEAPKPITTPVIKTAPVIQQPAIVKETNKESKKSDYEIYKRFTEAKPEIPLAKNEKFDVKAEAPYSETKPIPVNTLPKQGLIFTVQVGAFKNPIPQNTFGGITPITAETTDNGYMRYFAGQFTQFNSAKNVQTEIRNIGYKDAFVVAFYNGKRISISDANRILNGETYPFANAAPPVAMQETTKQANTNGATTGNISNTSNVAPVANTTPQNNISNTQTTITSTSANVNIATGNPTKTENVSTISGLFYTVQVGVFSQAMPPETFYNLNPLFEETLDGGKIRYTVGVYDNITMASEAKNIATKAGIGSAFVTAFYKSKKITLAEAKQIETEGKTAFASSPVLNVLPYYGTGKQTASISSVGSSSSNKQTTTAQTKQTIATTVAPVTETQKTETTSTSESNIPGDVVFKVQVGAFREEVPVEQANLFFKIANRGITNYTDENGITYYAVGNCKTYEQAIDLKLDLLQKYNIKDAFIVAYKNGKKVPLSEVKKK